MDNIWSALSYAGIIIWIAIAEIRIMKLEKKSKGE